MSAKREHKGLRVLVADDNQDIVLTLQALLEDEGHTVHTAYNGAAAVTVVREFQPNVCILDIDMPGASGFTIARELKEAYGAVRPFLIAISGKWYRGADRLLALEVGFDHFLEKPTDPAEISRLLADVSRRMRAAA